MGITPSVNLQSYLNSNLVNDYYVITMGWKDRLRLILAPEEIIQSTQEILTYTWKIQETHKSPGFVEFTLKGRPWYNSGVENLNVKFFICALLKRYYSFGWHLETSSDLTYTGSDTDVLFFRRKEPLETYVMCLSLNSSDKIRVLGPENLVNVVKQAICKRWTLGIQNEQQFDKSYEFKLKGNPWTDWAQDSKEAFLTPCLISDLFKELYRVGWIHTCGINSCKDGHSVNGLYFRYAPKEFTNDSFMALTLNKTDRIRLFDLPNELISVLHSMMNEFWPKGIQQEGASNNCYEFKLKGNPWCDAREDIEAKRLLNNIFNLFSQSGWKLYSSCDLTNSSDKKSSFFFKYSPQSQLKIQNFCLSLNNYDKIRLINDHFDANLKDQIKNAILLSWRKGIQKEKDLSSSWQFQLVGYPFNCMAETHVYTCILMMTILKTIHSLGYRLICSADVSGNYIHDAENHTDTPIDLDSWFFEKEL